MKLIIEKIENGFLITNDKSTTHFDRFDLFAIAIASLFDEEISMANVNYNLAEKEPCPWCGTISNISGTANARCCSKCYRIWTPGHIG